MDTKTIKKLTTIASQFRKGLLDINVGNRECFKVSAALQGYMEFLGYRPTMTEGDVGEWQHYWLTFPDGTILDATADQFGLAKVYIGEKPANYKVKE